MKNKKLHDIMNHSNDITKSIVDKYELDNAKDIAKINQVTDLLLAIKDKKILLTIIYDAIDRTTK